jgi:MFS family permease
MAFFRSIFNLRFSGFVLVIALTIFATYLPQPLSPNYLQNQKLLPLTSIGFLFFVNGGGIVTFNLLLGTFAPLLGIFASQVLVMLFSLLLINTNTLPTFMLAFFILGSYRAAHTVSVAQLRNYIQPESMGLAYGFAESVFALAMILASFFAGYLYENNPTAMYSTSILLILVALAFTLGFTFLTRSNAEKSTSKLNSADKQNELSLPESEQTLS